MRWAMVLSACVLAGCATRPPPRVVLHHPARAAHREAAQAQPPKSTPVKLESPTPRAEGPGSNIPLEGFRPMHGQSGSGA